VAGTGPVFFASANTATSIGTASFTKIIYEVETFDIGGCYNNTGSTVTLNGISVPSYSFAPNVAGYYQINANQYLDGAANNSVIGVFKNNSGIAYGSGIGGSANVYYQAATIVYCNGTSDYVDVRIYSGTASLSSGTGSYTFSAALIRSS
jgi:hypothetical protein